MTVLDIRDLSLSIGSTPILKTVSLSVAPGEILGLVGESGSGKSMTALAVLGLTPPRATMTGEIRLNGQVVSNAPDAVMQQVRGRDVGIIFQEPMTALNPVMTIGDQVAETVRLHRKTSRKEALAVARSVLDRVGLPAEHFPLTRYPHELSGGQRQRVGVARALAADPPVLLMDEPFGALDPIARERLQDEFLALHERVRKTVVLVTHDIDEAVKLGDRIAVMRQGGYLEQYDRPAAVLGFPTSDFVADFVGSDRAIKRLRVSPIPDDALGDDRVAAGPGVIDVPDTASLYDLLAATLQAESGIARVTPSGKAAARRSSGWSTRCRSSPGPGTSRAGSRTRTGRR